MRPALDDLADEFAALDACPTACLFVVNAIAAVAFVNLIARFEMEPCMAYSCRHRVPDLIF